MSTNSMTCSFCTNKKIPGPHGHSVRDFTKKNKPITCPYLLAIECQYCHEKGHTVKFCDVLKNKKLSNTNSSNSYYPKPSRPNKRTTLVDCDGFISNSQNKQKTTYTMNHTNNSVLAVNKALHNSNLTNSFKVLDGFMCDVEEHDSDNEYNSNSEQDKMDISEKHVNSSWSNIVSNHKNQLPNTSSWGEMNDDDDNNDYYYGN